jgi:hypothetical protein
MRRHSSCRTDGSINKPDAQAKHLNQPSLARQACGAFTCQAGADGLLAASGAEKESAGAGLDTARRSAGRLADTTARVASNPTQIKNKMSARTNRLRFVLQAIEWITPGSVSVPEAGVRGSCRAAPAGNTGSPGGSPSRHSRPGTDFQCEFSSASTSFGRRAVLKSYTLSKSTRESLGVLSRFPVSIKLKTISPMSEVD